MSDRVRSTYGAQSPMRAFDIEYENELEVLFAESDRLISSINATINSSSRVVDQSGNSSTSSSSSAASADLSRIYNYSSENSSLLDETNAAANERSGQDSAELQFDESRMDAEIENIHRYCETIENNLTRFGLNMGRIQRRSVGANTSNGDNNNSSRSSDDVSFVQTSTPERYRANARARAMGDPVEVIDLSTFDFNLPVTAASRAPAAVIDLCTPEGPPRNTARQNRHHNETAYTASQPSQSRLLNSSIAELNSIQQQVRAVGGSNAAGSAVAAGPGQSHTGPSPPKRTRVEPKPEEEETYKCPVCLECVRLREPVSTRCGHVFCNVCIQAALRSTHKCPMCNKKMNARQIFRIYI